MAKRLFYINEEIANAICCAWKCLARASLAAASAKIPPLAGVSALGVARLANTSRTSSVGNVALLREELRCETTLGMSPSIEVSILSKDRLFLNGKDLEEDDTPAVDTVTAAEQLLIFSTEAVVDLVDTDDKLIKSETSEFTDCLSIIACLDFLDF